ncbi:hypothetical protein [Pontixanthobacter sp.]|uniref:hypothetical protein n=1 Tax=Pontixanthobacter sp. TaxID=2792078 RepID=UPI003C7DBDA5
MSTAARPIATDVSANSGHYGASSYQDVRSDGSIQYAPAEQPAPPEPPGWLADLGEFLSEFLGPIGQGLVSIWPVLKWVLLAGAAALLVYILWQLLAPVFGRQPHRSSAKPEDWAPEEGEALALLSEADRLAATGNYDAATHLLLQRSVGQIAAARPDWVEPSSTARELAALPALPAAARSAFGIIAERVETSIFALKMLGSDDWETARAAYADFALQSLRGTPP